MVLTKMNDSQPLSCSCRPPTKELSHRGSNQASPQQLMTALLEAVRRPHGSGVYESNISRFSETDTRAILLDYLKICDTAYIRCLSIVLWRHSFMADTKHGYTTDAVLNMSPQLQYHGPKHYPAGTKHIWTQLLNNKNNNSMAQTVGHSIMALTVEHTSNALTVEHSRNISHRNINGSSVY